MPAVALVQMLVPFLFWSWLEGALIFILTLFRATWGTCFLVEPSEGGLLPSLVADFGTHSLGSMVQCVHHTIFSSSGIFLRPEEAMFGNWQKLVFDYNLNSVLEKIT